MAIGDYGPRGFGEHYSFTLGRGRAGYELDWEGERIIIKAAGAAKAGMQETMELMVLDARSNHPDWPPPSEAGERFANRTEQTIEAVKILEDARIEWNENDKPVVYGRWGVEEGPAVQDPDYWREARHFGPPRGAPQDVSIVDRAMFLEFGRSGRYPMAARPFLYPAFDRYKHELVAIIAATFRNIRPGHRLYPRR